MIFDSHAHYDDEAFDLDRDELLNNLSDKGVCGIINCGVDIKTSEISIGFAEKYPFIRAAVGIHPQTANEAPSNYIDEIIRIAKDKKVVAIGEIGLDYYYDNTVREVQLEIFEKQLILANELNLPVIVHDREAHKDTLDLLKKHRPSGVVHCFSGRVEMMHEVVSLGMYIGLGGAVTFKNAKHPVAVAEQVPIDRFLLETDAPYMTPVPYRGKRCNSSHIIYTAAKIAEVRGMECNKVLSLARDNANRLFSLEL